MKPPFDLSETDRLLTTTRAVRRRLDLRRPVERSVLLDCIRIAQQAPTGGNSQGWHFVCVTDPDLRRGLAQVYRDAGAHRLQAAHDQATDAQTRRVYASALHLVEILHQVPVHVLPCVEATIPDGATNGELAGLYANILPAAWSFMLALRSRGLGSAWTTQTTATPAAERVTELLALPSGVTHVALLPVAYTVGSEFRPAKRPQPGTVTHWNGW